MPAFDQRGAMLPLTRSTRAYFAPVNRATGGPAIFDPAKHAAFDLDAPPAPWIALGCIAGLKRSAATEHKALRSGVKGAVQSLARHVLGAEIAFEFREWGKLQMALSAGSQHMNLLAGSGASERASGGAAAAKVAVQAGSTATEIVVGAAAIGGFSVGDIVAVDRDFTVAGYVGAGVAAAYVKAAAGVGSDPDYIRRVTFNVGRVSGKTATALQLAQPLLAGTPSADMFVQKVAGFVDREGGSFFQEWSAVFVLDSETGARVFYHYPRLQPASPAAEESHRLEKAFDAWLLHARFIALPTKDLNDNETVLCYRSFIPAAAAALY